MNEEEKQQVNESLKTLISHSPDETRMIAKTWLAGVSTGRDEATEALVVGLSGNLGSGKTAFVQAVAHALRIDDVVTSPTYVIMKAYPVGSIAFGTSKAFKRIVHIDAYRLESASELEALNFEQWVEDPGNLILIEWPEKVKQALPESAHMIRFENRGEGVRAMTFQN